jgi:hypothetical protein
MKSLRKGLSTSALVALVLVALVPASAGAASAYRPDARVKIVCAGLAEWRMCDPTLVGDDVYNADAKGQKRVWRDYFEYASEPDPRRISFKISIENDGLLTDRFTVRAGGVSRGYTVRFFRGAREITADVENGTYLTPQLAPGEFLLITARVAMNCAPTEYCDQERGSRLVSVASKGNPESIDTVRFVRMRWICTC